VYLREREWPLVSRRLVQMRQGLAALGYGGPPVAARTVPLSLLRQALCAVAGLPLEALASDEAVEVVYLPDPVQEARRVRLAEVAGVDYRPEEVAGVLPDGGEPELPGAHFGGRLDRREPGRIVLP
jgi:hypothetical protein